MERVLGGACMSMLDQVNNLKDTQCIVDILCKMASENECVRCGKCVFGYEGVTQLQMILGDITEKKGKSTDMAQLQELCQMMKSQSLCETGEELGAAVLAAIDAYRADFEDHIGKKGCRAGVCRKFMTYHILAEQCTGCGDCLEACEEEAILGKAKFVHVIEQKECIQCGACLEACGEDAVVRAGTVKPRCPKRPIPCKRR